MNFECKTEESNAALCVLLFNTFFYCNNNARSFV